MVVVLHFPAVFFKLFVKNCKLFQTHCLQCCQNLTDISNTCFTQLSCILPIVPIESFVGKIQYRITYHIQLWVLVSSNWNNSLIFPRILWPWYFFFKLYSSHFVECPSIRSYSMLSLFVFCCNITKIFISSPHWWEYDIYQSHHICSPCYQ